LPAEMPNLIENETLTSTLNPVNNQSAERKIHLLYVFPVSKF
jgi:hypothetical protein